MTQTQVVADAQLLSILDQDRPTPPWLERIDRWALRAGDAVNPILVKETRQALKSRQFVATFSLLLLAALGWTVVGSLLMMPQIYFLPSGPTMLVGYYLVLAVPMLLVIPLAAYRSLEAEIDDGTLELLSITSLSPRQIVIGKLASAALQMMLYFVALFPCVAYAYTLRGIDLPTVLLVMGLLLLSGLTLTIIALFFAPLATGRTGQITSLLALLSILVVAEWAIGFLALGLILQGNPMSGEETAYVVFASIVFCLTASSIFLAAAAAQLAPESENRTTAIRIAVLVHQTALIGVMAYSLSLGPDVAWPTTFLIGSHLLVMWVVVGAMLSAEASTITARMRRSLPSTFLGRLFLTWLTPGPATGLVFAVVNIVVLMGTLHWLADRVTNIQGTSRIRTLTVPIQDALPLLAAYLAFALVGVRALVAGLRARNPVRVSIGLAAMAVVLLLMAIVPYSIGLHLNEYRTYGYSLAQVTNWAWTIGLALNRNLPDEAFYLVLALGAIAFIGHLVFVGRTVLPQKLATPRRVLEERDRLAGVIRHDAEQPDPLGLGTDSDRTQQANTDDRRASTTS